MSINFLDDVKQRVHICNMLTKHKAKNKTETNLLLHVGVLSCEKYSMQCKLHVGVSKYCRFLI